MQLVISISEKDRDIIEFDEDFPQYNNDVLERLVDAVIMGIVLPKNHGRLIDVDKLNEEKFMLNITKPREYDDLIRNVPTIIEADKEE